MELGKDVRDGERMLHEVLAGDALLSRMGFLSEGIGALEELRVRLGVVGLDGPEEVLEGLPLGRLSRPQAREKAPPAFGSDLLTALQLWTSSSGQCSRGAARSVKRGTDERRERRQ
jgi:hypothetical protein